MSRRRRWNTSHPAKSIAVAIACNALAVLGFLTAVQHVAAQLPSTTLNTLTPTGAKQGATIDLTVTGGNLDAADRMIFSHAGITATAKTLAPNEFLDPRPQPGKFELKVAADVPPGVYEARLLGHYGISNPRFFVVGSQDEISDNNANRSIETAQELPIGHVANGKADANQTDYYKLSLKKGQRVLVECVAWRIDSRLDAVLSIYDANGAILKQSHDYDTRDSLIDFTADAEGDYFVGIRDFLFGGGAEHFYRLRAHAEPHVDFCVPASVVTGQKTQVQVYGRNLPGGKPSPFKLAGVALDMVTVDVTAAADAGVSGYVPLATSTLRPFTHASGPLQARMYRASAPAVIAEPAEPNDSPEQASAISAPVEVSGQFYPAADVDWYQFEAKKGDAFQIEVISHRLGLDTDPNFVIQRVDKNDKGEETVKEVAFVDDPGDRNGRVAADFDTSTDDPSTTLAIPEDGVYRIRVTDQFGGSRTDPRMQYRLVIRQKTPDFRAVAFVKQYKVANNNQVPAFAPFIRQGEAMPIDVRVDRLDGFAGEVSFRAEGLPGDVACPNVTLAPTQTTGTLVVSASDAAKAWHGPVKIIAESELDGEKRTHTVAVATVVWGTANRGQIPATFRVTDLMLSVAEEQAPASVQAGDQPEYETSLGGKVEVPVKVTRRGHAEDMKLVAVNALNEFKPADITVKKDQGDGKLAIAVKNNAKPGSYTFFLRSDTKTKYAANPQGVKRAEADQKKLEAAVKATADDVKAKTDVANKAKAAQTTATAENTKAQAALKTAQAKATQTKAAADKAKKAAQTAEAAATAKADDAKLKEAAAKAKQAAETTAKAATDAEQASAKATDAATAAKAKLDAATKAQTEAAAALKASQDKAKRATDAKKAADTNLANVKKAAAAKDINIAVISTPVRLKIVKSPFAVSTTAPDAELKAEAKSTFTIKLEKKYGFDEPVDVTGTLPKGVGGITIAKLQIAKGAAEGMLEFSANAKPSPGDHEVTLVARGKFNNVPVEASTTIQLKVPAAEEKK